MKKKGPNRFAASFNYFSEKVTKIAGSSIAFISAFSIILIWAATGPLFH
jgi:low affinity Fe/Cu permease